MEAEMEMFSATEALVDAMKREGMTRSQGWEYIRSLPLHATTQPLRLTQFNMIWPEEA